MILSLDDHVSGLALKVQLMLLLFYFPQSKLNLVFETSNLLVFDLLFLS